MSFSKRVPEKNEASNTTTKMAAPKAPQAGPSAPGVPAVVVSRSVEVGGGAASGPRSRPVAPTRPVAPNVAIPPAPAPPPSRAPARPQQQAAAIPPPPPSPMPTRTVKMARPVSVRPPAPDIDLSPRPPSVRPPALDLDLSPRSPSGRPPAPDIDLSPRPHSVRPPVLDINLDSTPPRASIADTFERMLSDDDVDATLATLGGASGPNSRANAPTDYTEVRALFAQLAANHVRQVRDFVIDLRSGEASADWIPICVPALTSLRRAADKLEFMPLCEALDRLAASLTAAGELGLPTIAGDTKATLLACYEELVSLMPQAFALDQDKSQRESVILQSLLMQIPGVKKVTIDRLYAAGLTTLEAMNLAKTEDLAATAGIALHVAHDIVERFRAYQLQITTTTPDATRAGERERLAELTAKLRQEHDGHEHAAEHWSADAADKKKELRKARAQTLLDIQVLLARLGEVERLAEIERLPFGKKVERLEAFLEEARDIYSRPA